MRQRGRKTLSAVVHFRCDIAIRRLFAKARQLPREGPVRYWRWALCRPSARHGEFPRADIKQPAFEAG